MRGQGRPIFSLAHRMADTSSAHPEGPEYSVVVLQEEDAATATAAETAAAAEPSATPPPEASAPVYWRYVPLGEALHPDAFLPVEKVQGLYAARLMRPVTVQTPAVTLASPLDDLDECYAHLVLPKGFGRFAQDTETRVLQACLANKVAWFRRALDDDVLKARFKEFYKSTHLMVRLAPDFVVFGPDGQTIMDRGAVAPGTTLRCILQLNKVCFGRSEFGAAWTLVQAQAAPPPPPPPKCMIDPSVAEDDEDDPVEGGQDDHHEFS